jgi:hypothetical protein
LYSASENRRGDLAALPAAHMELLGFHVTGTTATLETVCRGGLWAWVEFTDDLAAPKTWTNLPASVQHHCFRIVTQ